MYIKRKKISKHNASGKKVKHLIILIVFLTICFYDVFVCFEEKTGTLLDEINNEVEDSIFLC